MAGSFCYTKGECFARSDKGRCSLLKTGYPDGNCPFRKPDKEVTNGKRYPFDKDYGMKHGG